MYISYTIALCPILAVSGFHVPFISWEKTRVTSSLAASRQDLLPSAYDTSLPAGLRGEAVRSAIKSDRGICIDFTSPESTSKNVGAVKVSGEGTVGFLNNKLCNTYASKIQDNSQSYTPGEGFEIKVERGISKEGGLLNSKGHMIDVLNVCSFPASDGIESYMITSPGHYGSKLFDRLDPFIFPLDGIKLKDVCPTEQKQTEKSRVLTFAAKEKEIAQKSLIQSILPSMEKWDIENILEFPSDKNECLKYSMKSEDGCDIEMLLCEQTYLPNCLCNGYTVLISDYSTNIENDVDVGAKVWNYATADANVEGPVALGPLEYETLRIEGGQPAYGFEMTGYVKKSDMINDPDVINTKASPLELRLDHIVDSEKGCYQGQEGVAALLKNKRGLPRTLYSVIFPDEDNLYEGEKDDEMYPTTQEEIPNATKNPEPSQDLFVLGSNQSIKVGTLTSVSEREGTSLPETVAMALVRRSDTILKKMKDLDLEIERNELDPFGENEGIIMPPPLDPLEGLDVVVGDGMTRGYLKALPRLRLKSGQNLFEIEWQENGDDWQENGSIMSMKPIDDDDDDDDDDDEGFELMNSEVSFETDDTEEFLKDEDDFDDEELKAAEEAARISAEEAARKEEKLKMLQKRAEEAMAKRKAAKEAAKAVAEAEEAKKVGELDEEAEAGRKAAKMEILRKRAEEAMARRKSKK
ncbi:hypothetical protein CTEN210_16519 [Chaetoceros tenuissimus]|uniref:Uncharacterized protein n=1 Tax=Chaetoceros tenuissimus TaxID=426638 RepID=A0AAD3D951_9STRA|nr:hypothetical protein CTEN210_16519 [Chaetoceros tenuissimus]